MSHAYFRLNRIENGPDNTLYVYPEQDEIMDAAEMLELLEILKNQAESIPFKMIFVLNGNQLYLTKDARELYKTNQEASELILAQAAVFDSITTQILVDLILKLYAPPYPLKPFRRLSDAETWIRGIKA